MQKQLLIFDLDGTLLDSLPDLVTAINFALARQQLPAHSASTIRNFVGNGAYTLCQRAATAYDEHADVASVYQDFLAYYAKHSCDDSVPYTGVTASLRGLQEHGYTLAIATNKPEAFLPAILAKLGWDKLFAKVVGGDSLPSKKPDPAPLYYLCDSLGFSYSQAIMIGDSKNDILAGKAAGMVTLALSYGYNYGEPISISNPDKVFDDFSALTAYLLTR